jgi:hypothetical protein
VQASHRFAISSLYKSVRDARLSVSCVCAS